jgi:inorganic pyrophosphatase
VIEGEQGNRKNTERNDRVVAVDIANHQWQHIRRVDDLGKQFVKEIEEFSSTTTSSQVKNIGISM